MHKCHLFDFKNLAVQWIKDLNAVVMTGENNPEIQNTRILAFFFNLKILKLH